MSFVSENWELIVSGLAALWVVIKAIVKLTPPKADDKVVEELEDVAKKLRGGE